MKRQDLCLEKKKVLSGKQSQAVSRDCTGFYTLPGHRKGAVMGLENSQTVSFTHNIDY